MEDQQIVALMFGLFICLFVKGSHTAQVEFGTVCIFYFILVYMRALLVCLFTTHMPHTHRVQKASGPPELDLQMVVSLAIEPGSSKRAVRALNC